MTDPTASPRALIAAGASHLRGRRFAEARAAFLRATQLQPGSAAAWRGLGNALHGVGDRAGGGAAHLRALQASAADPVLVEAGRAVASNRLQQAYPVLRKRLQEEPNDIAALRIMADLAARMGRHADTFRMLARAIELAPGFTAARAGLRNALYELPRAEALAEIETQLARQPGHIGYRNLKAALLDRSGDYKQAIAIYRDILGERPNEWAVWMTLGHALTTIGRHDESVEAYRRSLELRPTNGEAWWALANLKTYRFTAADIEALQAGLARSDLDKDARFHFEFALGKAREDEADYAGAFEHYERGNQLRRALIKHDPAHLSDQRRRAERLYTPAFFAERAGWGDAAPDPIFIVGMPRSGSTLVDQILASHPEIEGTMELDDLQRLVRRLDGPALGPPGSRYPDVVGSLTAEQCRELGAEYLRTTRPQRKTDRPRFIDKLPANFRHIGLIRTILPNARIVDVRRDPMACCFSCYKQHFARGHDFSYDLAELGGYYAEYVRTMALWDELLPGHVHRLHYEALVGDLEAEVRRLLDYLGLPFDPACLSFHETRRAIRTPSAEQVRQPLYAGGVDHWRHFEPWLGPLKAALQ